MPIQKGKKRRRPRSRGLGTGGDSVRSSAPAVPASKRAAPVMRRGWQPPMWVNIAIGVVLCAIGVVSSIVQGLSGVHLLILLAYFGLAGLYFGKALRQYRSKRQP